MKSFKNSLCVLMLLLFLAPCSDAAEVKLRFAGQFPEDHSAIKSMREIANGVREKTGGRVEIEVFPANRLGDYTIIYEDLMRGAVDMALISVPSQFDPRLELVYLNAFANYDVLKREFKPGSWLSKKMNEYNTRLGVKFLGFNIEGLTGIASKKPVREPLNPNINKGVLARVPFMNVYKPAAEAQGYRTISLPYSDIARSLQDGTCDAVSSISTGAALSELKGIMKYWYQLNYSQETESYLMSAKSWDKLSEDDLAAIYAEVAKASAKSFEQAQQNDRKNLEMMRKNGVQVFTYTDAELLPLRRAVMENWKQLDPTMGAQLMKEARKHFSIKDK